MILQPDIPDIEYEVEKIVDCRYKKTKDPKTKKWKTEKHYLIKWVGFEVNTWEPEENLTNCQEILKEFKNQKKKNKKDKLSSKSFINMPKNNKKLFQKKLKAIFKAIKDETINYGNFLDSMEFNDQKEDKKEIEEKNEKPLPNKNNGLYDSIDYSNESGNMTNNITDDKEKNEFNNNNDSKDFKIPLFSNIMNKFSLFENQDYFGPKFSEVLNADKNFVNGDNMNIESKILSMKKRNRNDSFSYFGQDGNNFMTKTDIKINKKKNFNDNNSNINKKNGKISEVRVPFDKRDKIIIKIGKKFYNANDKRVSKKELLECSESIIRKYFKNKTLIFG